MNSKWYVVNSINENLMYFKCTKNEETIFVNAALFCCYYNLQLPKPGTIINIDKYCLHSHNSAINDQRVVSLCFKKNPYNFSVPIIGKNSILGLIDKYRLGSADLLEMMKMYEYLKEVAPSNLDITRFIFMYVEKVLSGLKLKEAKCHGCLFNRLPNIDCKVITQMKQIMEVGSLYVNFPYWSFGTRWSTNSEVLIGTLNVHPKLGTICLTDSKTTVGCIITKNYIENVEDLLERPVYIEKSCVISEIFNPNSKFNLEYLYINFNDIHTLDNKRKNKFEMKDFKFEMSFVLRNKSNVTCTSDKGIHFWIEISDIVNYNMNASRCFLCLNENFVRNWPFLEVSRIYTLRFNKELVKTRDVEYNRVNPKLLQFILRPDNAASLNYDEEYTQPQTLPFLNKETLPNILQTQGLVSFQAILKGRKFVAGNGSRTRISNIPPMFGTVGQKTHLLDFKVDNNNSLSLYLNNWERMMTPIGLIPGALINVKNIIVQKTYCKSTAFTFLEVVKYEPRFHFQTARLLDNDDWGLPTYIGGSKDLPNGVLIHCIINSYQIIKFHLKRSCQTCSYMSRVKGEFCERCNGEMKTVCSILILVRDARGIAKITINRLEMARVFLGMREDTWKIFLSSMEVIGQYTFDRFGNNVNYSLKHEQIQFINKLNYIMICEERSLSKRIRLLCRKIDNTLYRGKVETFWFGVGAKLFDE